MANRRAQREAKNLEEDLGPYYDQMSQRNRSGRGSNRSNVNNAHGEEVQIWERCKGRVEELVKSINTDNKNLRSIVQMDKELGSMDPDNMQQMEGLCEAGVTSSKGNKDKLKILIEELKVLRAVVVAKEQAEKVEADAKTAQAQAQTQAQAQAQTQAQAQAQTQAQSQAQTQAQTQAAGPSKRSATRDSATAASLYDFDTAGDSPVPSPMGGSSRKHGDRSSNRDRDSMPPKADSVEPQGSGSGSVGGSASSANNRSKVVFSKGNAVAFKPKAVNGEQTSDWILGEVAQVLGEGKSRRYKVLDIEPDDQSKQKEYRSSASSMIPIAPESQARTLKDHEAGQVVLALYPNTTTFYKAEVHSMAVDGKVNLKFEGENDSTTLQQVERRFVIEYRP